MMAINSRGLITIMLFSGLYISRRPFAAVLNAGYKTMMATKPSSPWPSTSSIQELRSSATVADYLQGGPFAAEVREIFLGSTNFTYRLFLQSPYAVGQNKVKTAILKYAAAETSREPRVKFNPERQLYEARAMCKIPWQDILPETDKDISPTYPTLKVPQLYWEDTARRVIIMEDCNPKKDIEMWEEETHSARMFFEEAPESAHKYDTAQIIGSQLGTFLANLHNWGRDPRNTPLLQDYFAKNTSAKNLTVQEAIVDLNKNVKATGVLLPDSQVSEAEIKLHKLHMQISNHFETLIMGDFWPGNVILSFDATGNLKQLSIIDWEFVMVAPAFLDAGNFIGEVFLIHYFERNDHVYIHLLSSFLAAYCEKATQMDFRMIVAYAGAHIIQALPRRIVSPRSRATKENARPCLNYAIQSICDDTIVDTFAALETLMEAMRSAPSLHSIS